MNKRIANIESDLAMIKYAVIKFKNDKKIFDALTMIINCACDAADIDSDTKYNLFKTLQKTVCQAQIIHTEATDTTQLDRKIALYEHVSNKKDKKIDWDKVDAIPEDSYDYDEAPELTKGALANAELRKPKFNAKELILSKIKPLEWDDDIAYSERGEFIIKKYKDGYGIIIKDCTAWCSCCSNECDEYGTEISGDININTIEKAKLIAEQYYKEWVLDLFDLGKE